MPNVAAVFIAFSFGCVTGSILAAPHLLRFRGGDDESDDAILGSLKAQDKTGKLSRDEITEKLNRVPVFCIMKPDGSVISLPDRNGGEGDECCTWFLSAAEVQSVFTKVKAANPDEADGLVINLFGLGSAFEMCGGWPDARPSEYEGKLLLQGDEAIVKVVDPQLVQAIKHQGLDPGSWRLPVFVGDGLAQTEGSEEEGTLRQSALPVFFSPYDLKDAYERVGVPLPKVGPKTMDIRQLVAYMAAEPEEYPNPWRAVEFITSAPSAELAKKLIAQKAA